MIVNGASLLLAAPIKNMLSGKEREHGVSHGLGEAGYDITIKQSIDFRISQDPHIGRSVRVDGVLEAGSFCIASAVEEFQMPNNLVGVVHDKSTWARRGLSVFNTIIEPGWFGHLTLELVYHGTKPLFIPAGAGIAQVIFHKIQLPASYDGKYQGQADKPVGAIDG